MNVLQTIPGLSRLSGGPSSCLYNLVCGLNNIGIDTQVLAMASHNPDNDIAHDPFINYIKNDQITPLKISRGFGNFLKTHVAEFDLVHANAMWTWHTHQSSLYSRRNNIPYIISPHGMLYPGGLQVSKWKKRLALLMYQRKDLEKATLIHATCEQERDYIREFGLRNPIAVIPNCINMPILPNIREKENDIRRFGFVGRINRYKNIHLILEAWRNLGEKAKDCELIIIGSGDHTYENELKTFTTQNKINNVVFRGYLSGQALSDAVNSLDFQILFSISENFGMVVPEALLHGVPVITSKGTPWQRLPELDCGWWINCKVDELTSIIDYALNLPEEQRKKMGINGQQYILNNFMVDKVATMMKEAYSWILNNTNKPEFIYD